jgi:hydrogenase maturation protease
VSAGRTLVAGIGNIFLSDDAFGVEVARRLASEDFGPDVKVVDFGIRGVHLAYELLDGYDKLVLIDALPTDDPPGTLVVMEPDLASLAGGTAMDAHSLDPAAVLGMLTDLGGHVEQVVIVGCQPEVLDEGMDLSPKVAAALDGAVQLVRELVAGAPAVAGKER